MDWHFLFLGLLQGFAFLFTKEALALPRLLNQGHLVFLQNSKCIYSYEVAVHTARGSKSTESDGYQLHALVEVTAISREVSKKGHLHIYMLDVRQPRLRRVIHGRVTSYPFVEQFEKELSKPFYFRQMEHGPVVDVLFPKAAESPQVSALKKGIAGAFQVDTKGIYKSSFYEVKEHDDSGIFLTKYNVITANDTYVHLHRTWTNNDYHQFADGSTVKGEHKVKSQHSAHVHLNDGKIEQVQRSMKALFRSSSGHPRAENHKAFENQDIEISTTGYSKMKLRRCSDAVHRRSKRSTPVNEHLDVVKSLIKDTILFTDADKIDWTKIGGEQRKVRPMEEVLRCLNKKDIKEREIAHCSSELHHMVLNDEDVFKSIKHLVRNRDHQNLTAWSIYVSALAAHGKYEAQNVLANAVKTRTPRPLNEKEFETLLVAIHYLPNGPLHITLFDALLALAFEDKQEDQSTATAMLVLAGLTERAKRAGYNETLSESVAEMIHNRYKNKSSLYHSDSVDHEIHLRDHIWAFGNLGHHSALPFILEHVDHDDSSIRSAVISAMRKMPHKYTDKHLMKALYQDEEPNVKAAVVDVFMDRHQNLSDSLVKGLEYAMWHANKGETLDSAIREFLENHGSHEKAVHLRKKRKTIHRRKRALFPVLRPREFQLGRAKDWRMVVGGQWLGAEAGVQFSNMLKLRVGIFGGKAAVELDNSGIIRGHLLKYGFEIAKGRASFRASASFKNDFPKDLIHTVADAADDLLRHFDSITNVVVETIDKFRKKLIGFIPLNTEKLTDFLQTTDIFLQNVNVPQKIIKGVHKLISFSKEIDVNKKIWKSLTVKIKKIEEIRTRITGFDTVVNKALETLKRMLKVVDGTSKYLPKHLPGSFNLEELLQTLKNVSGSQQKFTFKEYFASLGAQVPDGFSLLLPFKLSSYFSSLNKLEQVLLTIQSLGNSYLNMSSLLDSLKTTVLPTLQLPFVKLRSPRSQGQGFNFGLNFNWKSSLMFDLKLNSPAFKKIISILRNVSSFFQQFTHADFDLPRFFQDILPGGKMDLKRNFLELYKAQQANSIHPPEVLQTFMSKIINLLDSQVSNVSNLSDTADFFQELGPAMTQFANTNLEKTCRIHEMVRDHSLKFRDFGKEIADDDIFVLKEISNKTGNVLKEFLTFTVLMETLIEDIELNYSASAKELISDSLKELSGKMGNINNLTNHILDFANGTSSKVGGLCIKTANFTADVIDEIQSGARHVFQNFSSFIGPAAVTVKTVAAKVKLTVVKVKDWYKENLEHHVGKISRVAQIVSEFLSVLGRKKGFLNAVQEIAYGLNEALKHLGNLPEYMDKVRGTIDEVTDFANRAQNYADEIQKLSIGKQFGIDFRERARNLCETFQAIIAEEINELKISNLMDDVSSFFNKEVSAFVSNALPKLRNIKDFTRGIREELNDISDMVANMIVVLSDVKPFNKYLSPLLLKALKLPDCQQMKRVILDNTRLCVQKAQVIGSSFINQYKDFTRELKVFDELISETWKNFKIQKCTKSSTCLSKVFIEQGKVIKNKVKSLTAKLDASRGYTDLLQTCKEGVDNITAVMDNVWLLTEQVHNFSLKEDVQRVITMLQKITGQKPERRELARRKRTTEAAKSNIERLSDYLKKVKETEKKVQNFQENIFRVLRNVYDTDVHRNIQLLKNTISKLKKSYQLWQNAEALENPLRAMNVGTKSALAFAGKFEKVASFLSFPSNKFLAKIEEITSVVKPFLDKNVLRVTEVVRKVNGFVDKVSDFLNKIQTRQRGLDPSAYKTWQHFPYCSKDVCLRPLRRSSSLYLSTIFTWKFPHLDDLSSMQKAGRWLTPGLFDDYKVEGISQLSKNEMILGMYGVVSNRDKASLLVVTNFEQGVKKIIQLSRQELPFSVKMGGLAIARNYLWIGDSSTNEIFSIKKSSVISTFTSVKPSWVEIYKIVSVEGFVESLSYDESSNVLWVTCSKDGKAYEYQLTVHGDILGSSAPDPVRVIGIGENAQGMTLVRQFGHDYACISRCALIAGFQCKLEFHNISNTKIHQYIGENTLARVVRTPSGLESVSRVDNEVIAVAFSSGTFAEKENVELSGGDYEDRYFKLRLPILNTTFGITENCLYFKLRGNYILHPRTIFPIGEAVCGSKRKRSISQELLETDVYHEKLEEIHQRSKRIPRNVADSGLCMSFRNESLLGGSYTFFEVSKTVVVFGIPVKFFADAVGHYSVGYEASLCITCRVFKLGLIPGAWITVSAGASVPLLLLEAGVTIEAKLLETRLVPQLRVDFSAWPLQACVELKLIMTPLSIRVYLWYRFFTIQSIRVYLFGIDVKFGWGKKKTFKEWIWSEPQIDRILFIKCSTKADRTPPVAGSCVARQAAERKYIVHWHGFHEDSKIVAYHVRIGSIEGSDDYYSVSVGTSLSHTIENLPILEGRNVYVSVLATNDEGLNSPFAYCPVFQARRKGPQIAYVHDGAVAGTDSDYQHDVFSLGMNFAIKSDFTEIINLRWGVSSQPSCHFDNSETNVVPLTPLGDSNAIHVSGLSLQHGSKYFTRLFAMDKFGLKTVLCSDGVLIDTTPPIPVSFQDGDGDKDTKFLASLRRVRGKFEPFIDPESPIVKYEWKVVNNVSDKDVTSFIGIPLTQRTVLMEGLSLEAGTPYRLILRGSNAAGLQSVTQTDGFIPDITSPLCEGTVIDISDIADTFDLDFVKGLDSIQAKWKCFDHESDINYQLLGIGTYPGGDDIKAFQDVRFLLQASTETGMFYLKYSNIIILPRVRYHVTVKIINGAGLKKTISSDGISIDITPPTVAPEYIRDGHKGGDKNFTSERFVFKAHWEQAFADAESGVEEYHVGLGTAPGTTDIKSFYTIASPNVTITGLFLENGRRYYVTVVGCNRVGMCANASSNGATVDFAPPHTGLVITGLTGPPVLYQWITNSVWARWKWCSADEKRIFTILNSSQCSNDSFFDIDSGIAMFGMSVISQKADQLILPFKLTGRQRYSGRTVDLNDGVYSVAIEAKDKAGVTSRALSNSFIVDSSPPLITLVQHGHFGEKVRYVNSSVITFRSFFMVEDDLSVITSYKIGVGSFSGADDVLRFVTINLQHSTSSLQANWTSLKTTTVENSKLYFITILVRNSADLFTVRSSPPLLCDFEAPKDGFVVDGWGSNDADYQSFLSLYRAHWYGFTDFSGIETAYLGLSSGANLAVCDVEEEQVVSRNSAFHVLSGLALLSGKRYYACLRLVDRAGNVAIFHSNGVIVDSSPPLQGVVFDGTPDQVLDVQVESSVLRASWDNFTEKETRIVSYHLAFGSVPGAQDIQKFTNVGLVNKSSSTRLKVQELATGQRYYATVIAFNVLGMPSFMSFSNGVLVDFTPPIFLQPTRDGDDSKFDDNYTSENFLKATWVCQDRESNISSIDIIFGQQPGEADVMSSRSLSVSQTSFVISQKLELGRRYFATVRCTNKVGLTVVSFSDGIVFDNTAPTPVYVKDGSYQVSNRTLFLAFKFVDAESGVHAYKVQVWGKSPNAHLDSNGFFTFAGNVTAHYINLPKDLDSGKRYYVNVTAVNGVGLEATKQSDGFTIDMTPPVCLQVWDGYGDFQDDQEYASSSHRFTISWVCYDSESPIVRYRFSVKDVNTLKYAIPFYELKTRVNTSGTALITGVGRTASKLLDGHNYASGIELLNAVGMKTIYWTNGVTIDNTPPIVTKLKLTFFPQDDFLKASWLVIDKQSGVRSVSWGLGTTPGKNNLKNYTLLLALSANLSISSASFKQGITCFLNLLAINNAGLSSESSSNAVVVDRTAPNPGVVAAHYAFPPSYDRKGNKVPNSSLVVSWTGFADPESGIKETSWAIGTNQQMLQNNSHLYTKVVRSESVDGVVVRNQTLTANETYFVCVRVTNGAGLHRIDCSAGMLIILGQLSAGVVSDGPISSAKDTDFQLDDKTLWVHWDGFKDPVYGISGYDWCIRDQPPNPSGPDMCKWPFMKVSHLETKANRFNNLTLSHGTKYFVTVKAKNIRGDVIMSSSDGVVIDRTPPVGKTLDILPSSGKDTLYITSPSAPVVTWSIDDPESGISHFALSVGSFPFQSDLLSSQYLDSLSRSLDLDKVNFTIYEGLSFYVTVTAVNMVGLDTALVSQQVVVDWTPPELGTISDGNHTSHLFQEFINIDYQREKKQLFSKWAEFQDSESDVIEYNWCVGTSQGICNVKSMTSVNLLTEVETSVVPQEGVQYFVTVEAINGAGLKRIVSSDGIFVDNSPPVIEGVYHGIEREETEVAHAISQDDGQCLTFYWDTPYDMDSGISSIQWCAGTTNNSCDVVPSASVDRKDTSVKHCISKALDSGTTVFIMVALRNGAGINKQIVSSPLLIDSTPPTTGKVIVGNTVGTKYFKKNDFITAQWSGFSDPESTLRYFDWSICHANVKGKCVTPFVNVGLKTSIKIDSQGLTYGVSFTLIVRAFNKVGLFSDVVSNQFILDGTKPSAGTVSDGLKRNKDIEFQSSTTQLSANWSPFTDSDSNIAEYKMCAGKKAGKCDQGDFVVVGINLTGTINGLSLEHNKNYFVTVQATSYSGYVTTVTSNGVRVDSTPPVRGEVRDGKTLADIDYQADDTYLFANWDAFHDLESDVIKYTWCAGTQKGLCDIVMETSVKDRTSVGQQITPPLPAAIKIFVTVRAFNKAGASTSSSSDGFEIDNTAPLLLQVFDMQQTLHDNDIDFLTAEDGYCVGWDAMDTESGILTSELSICSDVNANDCLLQSFDVGNKTSLCITDMKFKEGVKYRSKIRVFNTARLSTELLSDGFVVDTTAPMMGEITFLDKSRVFLDSAEETFSHAEIAVQWHGFTDQQSGIRTFYICVGNQSGECNIKNFTDVGNATSFSFKDLLLIQGETYFVSVKAENRAGLSSDLTTSDGVIVDKTGPFNGEVILDGSEEGVDIDFQESRTSLTAHWNAFQDLESDVIKVTWCAGLSAGACDVVKETLMHPESIFVHKVLTRQMMSGQKYFMTVTATNGAGVTTSVTSDGVMIDDTPPLTGTVIDGTESDLDYLDGENDVSARWFGFRDFESGIDYYEVALCDTRNLSFCPQPLTEVGKTSNVTITGLDLQGGVHYRFIIRTVNLAGTKVDAFSNGFTVDFTPPVISKAWIGDNTRNVIYHGDSNRITVSWTPFIDLESGVDKYEVCLSSSIQNCSVATFINVGLNTSCTIDGLQLTHGRTYFAVVKSTNKVGMSSETTTDGVLIDLTPPSLKENKISVEIPTSKQDSLLHMNESFSRVLLKCSEEKVTSSWDEFEDLESGLVGYNWCVGTARTLCDVISLRSVGQQTSGNAIINKLHSGLTLFSTVYAVNGAERRHQIISDPCTVITEAPKLVKVIDIPRSNRVDHMDIDWTANSQGLSLSWHVIGKYLDDLPRLRIQVAITTLSTKLSAPRLIGKLSWNGELLKQPYMDILPWRQNVTIDSVTLQPWNRYRGIVRVWNEGDIYSEAASDGVRIEPSPPPVRTLKIRDKAAENEHLRWWPNLRLSPLKGSMALLDIKYISSPKDLELKISNSVSNKTLNQTDYGFDHGMFSPTTAFKIIVKRSSSGLNNTNTTSQERIMKVIPGVANSEGPCCASRFSIPSYFFSDTHLKPVLPAEDFGVSVAILPNDQVAIGSKDKIVIESLKSQTDSHSILVENASDPSVKGKIASRKNITGFLLNDRVVLYEHKSGNIKLRKTIEIGKCKTISQSNCSGNETWADAVGQEFAVTTHAVAVTGIMSASNNSVVAVFREDAGVWMFAQVLGVEKKDPLFGQSIALNERLMAVATGDGKNCCVVIYSITTLFLRHTICLALSSNHTPPLSLYLTETDALVVLSKTSRLFQVFQLNSTSTSHHVVCTYSAWDYKEELSGHFDVNAREDGFVAALGVQIKDGSQGVQLLGFQGIYSKDPLHGVPFECVNLGKVLARDSRSQPDRQKPRTSVAFKGNTILFGVPGYLTWPKNDHWLSTGRVFIATYCRSDHFRSRVSAFQRLRPMSCLPCKQGRKSFGGFTETCSDCTAKQCPSSNDPYILTSGICDNLSCVSKTLVANDSNGVDIHLNSASFFVPGPKNVYSVEVLETTRVNLSTSSTSESFVIDSTAPEVGAVYDGLGSDQNLNCSDNSTFGEHSQCSTRDFEDTDVDFTNNTREIHARWIDFLDNQSGIAEYFWCVGSQPMTDNIKECESTGLRPNGSHYGVSLEHGDYYYVTVVACNGAHRCSAAHSDGVTIDITPPVMNYVRDGVMGPDMDYQVFVDIIFAYFWASDLDSGVTSYEIAWGTAPNLTDISDFEEVVNTTVWRARLEDDELKIGESYYATVRATNGAGLLSESLSSDGIIVGKTEFIFDNTSTGSFFFDTVNINDDGTRKDDGVGQTYGTLTVPEGAVKGEVKLRCYSLDETALSKNKTEEGPVSHPAKTKPKQFLLGNYSFQIKALDPLTNTVQEGYRFDKPIKIDMFYDVANLVRANEKYVNKELTEEDVEPVLYLWDPDNHTWFDAALTCPEPWSHVNHSIKLLEVNVCHLTQFAFFWTSTLKHGLILFEKNTSIYDSDRGIRVKRAQTVTELEIPLRRSKGSVGNITVQWSLYHNDSRRKIDLIWPSSGKLSIKDGQWNDSITLNIASDEWGMPESVIWVSLHNATGGALLASKDETTAKIIILSTAWHSDGKRKITVMVVSLCVATVVVLLALVWRIFFYKHPKRVTTRLRDQDYEMSKRVGDRDLRAHNSGYNEDSDNEVETKSSAFRLDGGTAIERPGTSAVDEPEEATRQLNQSASGPGAGVKPKFRVSPLYETATELTGKEDKEWRQRGCKAAWS